MLQIIRGFINNRKGTLIENIIYILIIGALSYTFYMDKVQEPLTDSMNSLTTKISDWTNSELSDDDD